MIQDYDLVVIGDSPEAEFAAERAGRLRARVAWVTQTAPDGFPGGNGPEFDGIRHPSLRAEVMLQVLRQAVERLVPGEVVCDPQGLWDRARRYADIAVAERQPQRLQQMRVDVIEGLGRFETRPRLQLNVEVPGGMRELRSRNYLLAPDVRPYLPMELLQQQSSLNEAPRKSNEKLQGPLETLHRWATWQRLPQQVVMLGAAAEALVLAQILVKLGCGVTVIVTGMTTVMASQATLLPSFDPEFADLATLVLKASGVALKFHAGPLADGWGAAQQRGQSLRADDVDVRLMIAEGWRPHWPGLNLESVGLSGEVAVGVDDKLRTQHRQIYGCGAAVGHGPGRDAMAQRQAEVALRNGLWWPRWRVQEKAVIKTLPLMPMLAQVGVTESQAQAQYPGQITVVRQSAQAHQPAQLKDQVVGLCKLVIHRNGRLLGAQALAVGAEDWMAIAAQVIQQKGSVKDLAGLTSSRYASTSLLYAAAEQWRWERLAETPRREDLIERFFNWRRTGSV